MSDVPAGGVIALVVLCLLLAAIIATWIGDIRVAREKAAAAVSEAKLRARLAVVDRKLALLHRADPHSRCDFCDGALAEWECELLRDHNESTPSTSEDPTP